LTEKDVLLSDMDVEQVSPTAFRIGFVLVDGFALMSYAAAVEPLRVANRLSDDVLYDIQNMPATGARAVSSSGAIVAASTYLGEQVDFDLVLVVAGSVPERGKLHRLEHWLRLLANRHVLVGGISAGSVILVRAGVMEGRRMIVHRDQLSEQQARQRNVIVEQGPFVRDRGRLTCAGGTAPTLMMEQIIAEHHGGSFAQRVNDWFNHAYPDVERRVPDPALAMRYGVSDINVIKAVQAMESHTDDPLSLTQLANITGVGVRQINRLFREHLNCSTLEYYNVLRLNKAQMLLRQSLLSINEVGKACGFASSAHFSRQFKRQFADSPSGFRQNAWLTRD